MFDTVNVRTPTQFVTKEVHEHRAPTDSSVRLLREMEGAAKDNVLAAFRTRDNTFDAVWHVFYSGISDEQKISCRFKLNGKEHQIEFAIDRFDFHRDPRKLAEIIHQKLSEHLARIFTVDLFMNNGLALHA